LRNSTLHDASPLMISSLVRADHETQRRSVGRLSWPAPLLPGATSISACHPCAPPASTHTFFEWPAGSRARI